MMKDTFDGVEFEVVSIDTDAIICDSGCPYEIICENNCSID